MGFADQKFYTRPLIPIRFNATSTSTATASAQVVTNTAVANLPKVIRRTEITGGNAIIVTAPNAGAATTVLALLNGTSTFATATIGTLTAGQVASFSITAANAVLAAGTQPTLSVVSTSTASQTVTQGNYDLYWEAVERFA